ncbi:MAG: aspartate--tRNA ligase [Candidatus Wildermuthbacteria bacterium]|nr:aspartate--tRNA ligase [Candidatus Wildermuthbacteria bacterium]
MERILSVKTPECIGKTVRLAGWVQTRRDHGKIIFLDLRDREGIVQLVCTPQEKEVYELAQTLRPEWVVEAEGEVKERPEAMRNPDIMTGNVEVAVKKLTVLSQSQTLPFPIDTPGYDIDEDIRLKYRYVDLRRPRLQKNIKVRSAYVRAVREYLFSQGFLEIETPLLTKSTPEGSRDFVVPSRAQPGKFYALPQSPQQYKQLLMVAGFEKYFQIARALRDEDPRADRGFEHSQVDIEMSFVEMKDVMELVEGMTIHAVENIGGKIAKKPFPVFTYQEAIKQFGADKFDLRTEQEKSEGVLSFAWVINFPFFEKDNPSTGSTSSRQASSGPSGWTFTHNPFSAPLNEEHEKMLLEEKNIGEIITSQYDLVCNGLEVAGGSIRTHKPEVLNAVFKIMGYKEQEIKEQFGHMLEAFSFGAPPHGGCAQGFERLLMAFLGEEYLREVQAFPQTGQGRTSVMDAPSELSEDQLKELHLKVQKK